VPYGYDALHTESQPDKPGSEKRPTNDTDKIAAYMLVDSFQF